KGRARGLPCDRQRRAGRWADRLPPALAYPRRSTHGGTAMTLIAEIEEEVKDAIRSGDAARRDALRLILASLRSAEKDLLRPLSEDEELQVLQRERKKRLEAAEAFRNAGREEKAQGEEAELAV